MAGSETLNQLQKKIVKILGLLFLIRLGLYIPVPNVDLDIFAQNQVANPLFGLAKKLNWKCVSWYRFFRNFTLH
jgi:preprotein translocase subunit SecY